MLFSSSTTSEKMKRKNGTKKRKHTVGENLKRELEILKKKERGKNRRSVKKEHDGKKKSGTKKQKTTRNEK